MNKKDLIDLGIPEDVAEKVIIVHGKDIESHKAKVSALQAENDGLKSQVTEANTTIESFKAMKPEELKAAADDWKVKAEKAQTEAAAQMAALKFDHALESALNGAKVKNAKAVQALLSKDALKYNETDGSIIGLSEQLEKIKSENDYLFADTTPPPQIVTGGKSKSVLNDPQLDAMRKGAGLPTT